jgi:tol-pal system protein YbgF
MKIKHLFTITAIFFLAACAPQAELVKTRTDLSDMRQDTKAAKARVAELQKQVEQDQKRLDMIEANVKGGTEVQKTMADYGAKSDQLATDIQLLQGKLEENNFRITEMAQKLDDKSVKIAELSARTEELESKVKLLGAGTGTIAAGPSGTAMEKDKKAAATKTIEPSEAYRQAKNDYDKGNFDLAIEGFQNFIVQFPDASQADAAQYWIGECYYAKKSFSKAIDAFSKVLKNYPRSEKVPGAKLKIGFSHLNEKNTAKAKEYLNRVIKEHPHTTEAQIAKDRLRKLGK